MKLRINSEIVTLLLIFTSQVIFSQDFVRTTGTAQMELTIDKSRQEINNKLRELATIDALEKAFGRVIIQGNTTYITNLQTGQEVKTNTVFNTIANTSVKGEVIREIEIKFTDIEGYKIIDGRYQKITEIRCNIELIVREIVTPPITITSFPLGCMDEKCRTTSFKNNDRFYLFFVSPTKGYLTVYLDDTKVSQCLYPHVYMTSEFEDGVPIEADRKYFLFSDIDYSLYADGLQDMNRLFIIFSKTPMNKPYLSEDNIIDQNGYILPRSIPSEDFQRWLISYRSIGRNNVQVEVIDITITR